MTSKGENFGTCYSPRAIAMRLCFRSLLLHWPSMRPAPRAFEAMCCLGCELAHAHLASRRYPTFNRAIAPAYRTAYVIIDLCKRLGWDQVGVINGDTLEDFEAVRVFQNSAKAWNITVAATVNAASDSREDMEELVHHMHADLSHIRIWVMFFPVSQPAAPMQLIPSFIGEESHPAYVADIVTSPLTNNL